MKLLRLSLPVLEGLERREIPGYVLGVDAIFRECLSYSRKIVIPFLVYRELFSNVSRDGSWFPLCLVLDGSLGTVTLYNKGLKVDELHDIRLTGITIQGGGAFSLGQEQTCQGGCLARDSAFVGRVGRLEMWSGKASALIIQGTTMTITCKDYSYKGDFSWRDLLVQHPVGGDIEAISPATCP